MVRLEPDAVVIHQADDGDRYPEQIRSHRREVVERSVRRRIEDVIPPQCVQAFRLVWRQHGARVHVGETTTTCRRMPARNRNLTNNRSGICKEIYLAQYIYE